MLKISKQFAIITKLIEKEYTLFILNIDGTEYISDGVSVYTSNLIGNSFALDLVKNYISESTIKSKVNPEYLTKLISNVGQYEVIEPEDISTIDVVGGILSISDTHGIGLTDYNSNLKLIGDMQIEFRYCKESGVLFYCNPEDLSIYYAQALLVTQSKLFS